MRTTYTATIAGEDAWVTADIGGQASVRFRVRLVSGRAAVLEVHVHATAGAVDGLDATLLRKAVAVRPAIEVADPVLRARGEPSWRTTLERARSMPDAGRLADIALCAVGYVAALDEHSRRPIVEVARAMGRPDWWVKARVRQARDQGIVGWAHDRSRLRAEGKGVPDGRLTGTGEVLSMDLLSRRLGVEESGLVMSSVSGEPGTAAQLLRFLVEPRKEPIPKGSYVSFDASGAHVGTLDRVMRREVAPDGREARVLRR